VASNGNATGGRQDSQIEDPSTENDVCQNPIDNTPLTPTSNLTRSSRYDSLLNRPNDFTEFECLPTETAASAYVSPKQPTSANESIASMRERWMYPYISGVPAKIQALHQNITFLCRVFRTYPRMISRTEHLPPFMHEAQITGGNVPLPLANCFSLSRISVSKTIQGYLNIYKYS
jgi:hypothetical protein